MNNLGVQNFLDFIFQLVIDFDWRGWRLLSSWNGIGSILAEKGFMKNWVYTHSWREVELESSLAITYSLEDFERS
jgi:hypothetical protein